MDLLVLKETAHGFEGHAIAGKEVREQLYDFSARYGIGLDKSNTKWSRDPCTPWKQRVTVDVDQSQIYGRGWVSLACFGKLWRARSRLYRSEILQVNIRWKALAEIYTMHSFAPFFNLKISAKNRQHFFAIE